MGRHKFAYKVRNVGHQLRIRRRTMRRPRAYLETRQERRWRDLVRWTARRSPWYRRLVEEQGIDPERARPEDFPVLTKETLIAHFDEIATVPEVRGERITEFLARSRDPAELLDDRFRIVHSSGTSGAPCVVAYTEEEWGYGSSQFARIAPFGIRRRIAFVGASRGHFAGVSLAGTVDTWFSRPFYRLHVRDVNEPTDAIVAALNEYRPDVVVAYARVLPVLAEEQRRGRLKIRPRRLVRGGEGLPPAEVEEVRRTFGAPVINAYATSEHLFMGVGLPDGEGMALLEDDLLFELHPDCTLVTNLFNRTVPLIRYRLDDVLEPAPDLAGSYGPYRIVRDVVGRNEHAPVFRNRDGRHDSIHPIVLAEFFAPNLKAFQVHLLDDTSFRFDYRLVPGLEHDAQVAAQADIAARLRVLLAEKRMDNVQFDLREVPGFSHDPETGKFRLIVPPPTPVTPA